MDTDDALIFIAGLVIGGAAVYFLLKNPFNLAAATVQTETQTTKPVVAENAETIEWIDHRGNKRKMTIHREVRS